jgi:hypothetical protein
MENNFPIFDKVAPFAVEMMPYEYAGKDINIRIETGELPVFVRGRVFLILHMSS